MSANALSRAPRCEAEDQGGWPCCTYRATHYVPAEDAAGKQDTFYCRVHSTDEGNRFYRADQMVPFRKLTQAQLTVLESACECTPPNERAVRFGWSGMGAKGSTIRTAECLAARGLVEYVDHGRLEDDDNGDAERPIYAITERGRALLAKLGGADG